MKEKIKENAVRLFCKNGFAGTSVRNISDSVGITAAAVYAHFKSKEDLFLEVFAEGWRKVTEGVNNIRDQEKELNSEILFAIYKYYIDYYMNGKEQTIFLLRSIMFPPSELKEKIVEIFNRELAETRKFIKIILESLINKGVIRNISVEDHASIFYKLVNSFIFEITAFNKSITEEELNRHWQCYWQWVKA